MKQLKCGAAERCMTPELGLFVPGYFNFRGATGVKTDLYTHAIVLENDGKLAVLISMDIIFCGAPWTAKIRKAIAEKIGADAVCFPAHKGLWGIMGAGAVLFPHPREDYPAFLFGGSGAKSRERGMPKALPEHFEAGTLPLPAIAAFEAGIAYVEKLGISEIADQIRTLEAVLYEGLGNMQGVTLYGEGAGGGILSFTHAHISPNALADALSAEGFCVRAGLHCAPLAHQTLGTPKSGAVRISLGYSNTKSECLRFLTAMHRMLK